MRFDHPYLLALVPILAAATVLLLLLTYRRRAKRLARFGSAAIVDRLVPASAKRAPWLRAILLALAAAFAAAAFAGPRWGFEKSIVRSGGADIVLALDASLSMRGTDERPDRLEKMKQEARRLLAASTADRFGLIAFAGRSYILTPLTVDRGALELYLDNLDPSIVGQAGSSLARAIRQGTDLLISTRTGSDRALVVMSDGEAFEPEEDVVAAAKRAAEAGITLVTVGFGTTEGSTIPVETASGTTEKRDENGAIVVTRYHPELLQAAAEAANGVFIPANATDKASHVRRSLAQLRREGRMAQSAGQRRPRFQLFLIPAVLFVLLDTLVAERRGRRRIAPAAAATAAAMMLAVLLPSAAFASEVNEGDKLFRAGRFAESAAAYQRAIARGDTTQQTRYNFGTALLAAGRGDDAVAPLERASSARDLEVRYRALFNLGLIYLRRGLSLEGEAAEQAYSAAVDAYKRALRIRSGDLDAKWNYELANRKKKSSSGGGGGGGGGGGDSQAPEPEPAAQAQAPLPRPSGGLSDRQAEQILNSAARDEQEVQGKKQQQNRPDRPPRGKDWD